jgi:signal transduction histidine kinase
MIRWGFPTLSRWPLLALAVTVGVSAATMMLDLPAMIVLQFGLPGAASIEICYIAATRPRRVSVPGLVMADIGLVLIPLVLRASSLDHLRNANSNVPPAAAFVSIIAWLIGNSIRQAQARAELVRTQAAAQSALAERLRIARELHDVVAHTIGIITIQAGSGRSVYEASPAEARDALAAIEATGRETLSGLRRMMTGLRRAEPGPEQAPLGPAPGLADLDRLAATTLDAGVQIEVDWHGSREPLPAHIDLSAFRIIQEAVTNVVRHSGTSQCRVLIDQQDGQLSIEVTDSGRGGSGAAGTGYGITGMRERAALLGGDFSAGPHPGGGFRVAARLPVRAVAR